MATDNSKGRMRAPAGPDVLVAFGTFHGLQRLLDMEQVPIEESGSGMTRCIITPMIRRLLERRAAEQREAAGGSECRNPFDISIYMTDGMTSGRHADKGTP